MTNKETATMLKSIRGLFSVSYSPESIAALSKAIELIDQMPDEHGDLIDRDKMLKEIEMYHVSDGWFQLWLEFQDAVIAAERKDDGNDSD